MANLMAMAARLSRIRSVLFSIPVLSSGRPDDDDEADEIGRKLDLIGEEIPLILRELNSSYNLARMQSRGVRKLPQDQRWSANQSLNQRIKDASALTDEAKKLAELMNELLRRNGLLSPLQAGKKLIELISDFEEHLPAHAKAVHHLNTGQLVYTSAEIEGLSAHVETFVPFLTFVYVAVQYWKRKRKAKPPVG